MRLHELAKSLNRYFPTREIVMRFASSEDDSSDKTCKSDSDSLLFFNAGPDYSSTEPVETDAGDNDDDDANNERDQVGTNAEETGGPRQLLCRGIDEVIINGMPRHIRDFCLHQRFASSEDDSSDKTCKSDSDSLLFFNAGPDYSSTEPVETDAGDNDDDDANNERDQVGTNAEETGGPRQLLCRGIDEGNHL
ncbi:unnamed protein product [Acanthosepion pharaonis]|uniref:Uncharacterized protein n=1 Tax=Acanthosepion pharaonis TaxID=158019 RepID=A0A812BX90_ACAPH|nr:unnamed protein product [Sepia pharaonis]